ncbi:MAG: hypothetical protein ACREVQ_06485 [Burkholderiales bacterium]
MIALLAQLEGRREALVARSGRERRAIAEGAARVRAGVTDPMLVGLGVFAAIAGRSPRLRGWFVRAWLVGSILRRLLAR